MKIFYILSICFLFSTSLSGQQPLWTVVNDNLNNDKSVSAGAALLADSLILHWGDVSVSCTNNVVIAYDRNGEEKWRTPAKNMGGPFSMIQTKADAIYAAGSVYADDYNHSQLVLSAFDKQGNILFQTFYPESDPHQQWEYIPGSMDVSQQGRILVSLKHRSGIFMANEQGHVIWEREYDDLLVDKIQFLNEESFIINNMFLANLDGEITDTLPFAGQLTVSGEVIYKLTAHDLILMDHNFENIDTVYTNEAIVFHDLKIFDEKIWLKNQSYGQITLISLEDHQQTGIWSFTQHAGSHDFVVSGDRAIFTGTSPSGQMATYAYSLDQQNEQYPWPDITLVDFDIYNIDFDHYAGDNSHFYFDVEITLRNTGDHPVSSFAVFAQLSGFVNCAVNYLYEVESALNLMPQEEITVQYSRLDAFEPASSSNRFCFEVLSPNGMIELDISGNSMCKNFNVLSAEDLSLENEIRIFPNPASDRLTISPVGVGVNTLQLSDLSGKVLLKKTLSGQTSTLDVAFLSPGIYIIQVTSARGSITQKFVKR